MTTTPQAALLREAAQNALITLDGIASANPRDKADFETPDEWIAWAKSRARFAADALREPISQEVYAERILRQMLNESDHAQVTQADPVQPLCRLRIGVDGKYVEATEGQGGFPVVLQQPCQASTPATYDHLEFQLIGDASDGCGNGPAGETGDQP